MGSNYGHIKIHDQGKVAPKQSSSSSTPVSLPLTFFDLFWLRVHPVERIFFYTLQSHPSFFFQKVVPYLKISLSLTLQHFLPLAGNIVWPSDSDKPCLQYNPGACDGVSLVIAESYADFGTICNNNVPREVLESRSLVPHLESSNSHASVMSLQITLFPNKGFSIGITTHHAVLDGKSSTMFLKAWASFCKSIIIDDDDESSPTLAPELMPFFDREVINELEVSLMKNSAEIMSKVLPNQNNKDGRSLKIPPSKSKLEDSVRATFMVTREDLEKVKKKVLSKWDMVEDNIEEESMINSYSSSYSSKQPPPTTLSTFALINGYVSVCVAKAIQGVENERQRFGFSFMVDWRKKLDPPVPDSYFGNCIWGSMIDANPRDFTKEDGVVIVAKSIHNKVKSLNDERIGFKIDESEFKRYMVLANEGVEMMAVAGSNRFGVYGIDFGWGKPNKVEIVSVDTGLCIGLAENNDAEKGGVQVELVLNKIVMDLFTNLFLSGLSEQSYS